MARKVWHDDFTGLWSRVRPVKKTQTHKASGDDQVPHPGSGHPAGCTLGIVERNRKARREKWALRLGGS